MAVSPQRRAGGASVRSTARRAEAQAAARQRRLSLHAIHLPLDLLLGVPVLRSFMRCISFICF